ncbi:O-antigen/teichoic acid export membrane protein [Loktanella ponticola]|uniref:O-antigen/teichoic acid export membrane protein n=1 Tax=Yoonia ponticola TaxID=1524255 RepID=A0A7W9F1F6_9RHOB|nr:polysaccharide biosynthesis C-terminal domain-containing protein [Yoonia ponticola]MBB5723911.1 O-antigen/teichoic acid export membrane protein [Yoonia ponticola]
MKKHFLLSLIANVLRVVLGFLFFWQISQVLGLSELGGYLYVTTAVGYFGTIIDYGFNLFVLNTASRAVGRARSLFLRIVLSKLTLTFVCLIALSGLYGVAFSQQGLIVTALFFIIVVLMSFSGLLLQFFKALGRFEYELFSVVIMNTLQVGILFVLREDITLVGVGLIVLIVRILVLAFQLIAFLKLTKEQDWGSVTGNSQQLLFGIVADFRNNAKYALFSVFGAIFLSIDLVIMGFLLGPESVSIYGTAMKVILALILFFEVLNGTFTPRLARLQETNSARLSYEVKRFYWIMGSMAFLCFLVAFTLGPPAIVWAFGPEFEASGDLVRILALVFVFRVTEMTTGPMLTIYGLQSYRARAMVIVLPVHIGLNMILQSTFGVEGAVVTLAISFFTLFILNSFYLRRNRPKALF